MSSRSSKCRGKVGEAGFSLVEAVVALGVFALAGIGLATLQTQSLRTLSRVEERALADLLAQNRLVEITSGIQTPDFGEQRGDVTFAGRNWTWVSEVANTPDPHTLRVTVRVAAAQSETVLAQSTAFSPADASALQ